MELYFLGLYPSEKIIFQASQLGFEKEKNSNLVLGSVILACKKYIVVYWSTNSLFVPKMCVDDHFVEQGLFYEDNSITGLKRLSGCLRS